MSKTAESEELLVPEIRYFDICACGAFWQDVADVRISGAKQLECLKCKRLWDVTEAYIKKHLVMPKMMKKIVEVLK